MEAGATARGAHLGVLIILMSALSMVMLSIYAISIDWMEPVLSFLTSCPYRSVSGQPCPLCGTTTATALLFSGEIRASLAVNPLAAAVWPLGLSQLAYRSWRVARPGFALKEELLVDGFGLAFLVLILGLSAV